MISSTAQRRTADSIRSAKLGQCNIGIALVTAGKQHTENFKHVRTQIKRDDDSDLSCSYCDNILLCALKLFFEIISLSSSFSESEVNIYATLI